MSQEKKQDFPSKEEVIEIWKGCESSPNAEKSCDIYAYRFNLYDGFYCIAGLVLYPPGIGKESKMPSRVSRYINGEFKEKEIIVGGYSEDSYIWFNGMQYDISKKEFNELREIWDRTKQKHPISNYETIKSLL